MVAIPKKECPTIAALRDLTEAQGNAMPPRNYLGMSSIGEPCARKLWYKLNGRQEHFDCGTLWRFEDGHRTEDLVVARLKQLPFITIEGEQTELGTGRFKGHVDGFITGLVQAPKTKHVFEVKCVNEKKFKELQDLIRDEKTALKRWDETYYGQAMLYCYYSGLTRHYLVCATAGGRDMCAVRTDANEAHALQLIDKAQKIIDSKQPPERVSGARKDFFLCRWCKFNEECYAEGTKAVPSSGDKVGF